MDNINELKEKVTGTVKSVFNNKYFTTGLVIMAVLYVSLLGPKLPDFINNLFKYNIFKIIFFFLFLIVIQDAANVSISLAFVLAIGFVLTIDYLYLNSIREDFKNNKRETFN